MRLLPRSARGTWRLTAVVWLATCAAAWWMLPEQAAWRAAVNAKGTGSAVAFSPDGRWLATIDNSKDFDAGSLRFWNTATGRANAS
jgi:hypothetical protein